MPVPIPTLSGVTQRADDSEPVEGTPSLDLSEEVFPEEGEQPPAAEEADAEPVAEAAPEEPPAEEPLSSWYAV